VLNMKLTGLFIFTLLLSGPLISQDNKEHIVTKTFYNKWNVTYASEELFEYERASDAKNGGQDGVTILYFPMTMIDDGIYGSIGIILTKEKKTGTCIGTFFSGGHRK